MAMAALQQALGQTGPPISMRYCMVFFFFVITVVNKPAAMVSASPPTYIVTYIHTDNVPPNNTAETVVSTTGMAFAPLKDQAFGSIYILANPLREGKAASSPQVGEIDGEVLVGRNYNYRSTVYIFNTSSYAGSITAQGFSSANFGESAITGGTGDFRGAKGYLQRTQLTTNPNTDPHDVVFRAVLFIKYDAY